MAAIRLWTGSRKYSRGCNYVSVDIWADTLRFEHVLAENSNPTIMDVLLSLHSTDSSGGSTNASFSF